MKYIITKTNEVSIWLDTEDDKLAPDIIQPSYPSGEEWTEEEATAWAELYINQFNSDSTWFPGHSRSEPRIAKPEKPAFSPETPLAE